MALLSSPFLLTEIFSFAPSRLVTLYIYSSPLIVSPDASSPFLIVDDGLFFCRRLKIEDEDVFFVFYSQKMITDLLQFSTDIAFLMIVLLLINMSVLNRDKNCGMLNVDF